MVRLGCFYGPDALDQARQAREEQNAPKRFDDSQLTPAGDPDPRSKLQGGALERNSGDGAGNGATRMGSQEGLWNEADELPDPVGGWGEEGMTTSRSEGDEIYEREITEITYRAIEEDEMLKEKVETRMLKEKEQAHCRVPEHAVVSGREEREAISRGEEEENDVTYSMSYRSARDDQRLKEHEGAQERAS